MTWIRRGLQRAERDERGAQIVEFAILVPVLLLLIFGSLDFGRAYFSWIIITNGAREGARVASVGNSPTVVWQEVQAAVAGLPGGSVDPGSCPVVGAEQAWCVDTDYPAGTTRGNPVTVRVEYNFRFLVPGLWSGASGVFPLAAEATMRLE